MVMVKLAPASQRGSLPASGAGPVLPLVSRGCMHSWRTPVPIPPNPDPFLPPFSLLPNKATQLTVGPVRGRAGALIALLHGRPDLARRTPTTLHTAPRCAAVTRDCNTTQAHMVGGQPTRAAGQSSRQQKAHCQLPWLVAPAHAPHVDSQAPPAAGSQSVAQYTVQIDWATLSVGPWIDLPPSPRCDICTVCRRQLHGSAARSSRRLSFQPPPSHPPHSVSVSPLTARLCSPWHSSWPLPGRGGWRLNRR